MTGRPDAPEVHRFDEPHRDINGKRWYNGCGNPHADILFVDNWPGDEIKRTNRPLSDRVGRCLQWLLRLAGIDPRRCYYTYAVKYPFGTGKKPSGADKAACATMLREEIEAVSPKVVVAFGSDAWAAVAGAHSAPATRQMTDDDIEGIAIHDTPSGMKHIARRTDTIGQQDTMEVGMEQLEIGRLIEQSRLDASNIWTVADDVVVMQIPKGRGVCPIVHHTITLYFGQPYNHGRLAIASSKDDTRQLQ